MTLTIPVVVAPDLLADLDRVRGERSRSEVIREAIRLWLAPGRPP